MSEQPLHTHDVAQAPEGQRAHHCEHCDSSVPHRHQDVPALIARAKARSARRSTALLVIALALVVIGAVGGLVGAASLWQVLGVMAGTALGFALVTAIALVVTQQRASHSSASRGIVTGQLLSGGLAPVVGVVLGLVLDVEAGPAAWLGVLAAGVWLSINAGHEWWVARTWRALLYREGEAGEQARAHAVHSAEQPEHLPVAWAVVGAGVGLALWCAAAVAWWAAVVLVPLCVAVVAWEALRQRRAS